MRRFLSMVLSACLLSAPLGAVAASCSGDAPAVLALRTELMVAALGCGQRASYNSAVRRHKRGLAAAEREVISWFDAAGQTRDYDSWITSLANARSVAHAADRVAFCARTQALFREVASTPATTAALGALTSRRAPDYPALGAACSGSAGIPTGLNAPRG